MSQRADKWLHHVRVFKTRSLATQACTRGNVTIDGQPVKASRDLKPGDTLEVVRGDLRLRVKVIGFSAQRVGPPKVAEFCENLTPLEWIQKASELRRERELIQPRAHEVVAKPDKKQLRELRKFWEEQGTENL
ncbi:RNA-binding S4 domain-containing protein [Prosthecobacter sp.]|uniref:RNA-binding S4 domain-containing protein n=1 Tax=Prosthecobacter sp. TaxID=1965333 RepID=UPI0037849814